MRKDRFTDEAMAAAKALAELKYSEKEEDQLRFSEAYDFARCQRPDGSFYGTSGQCRKGKDAGAKAEEPKAAKPKATKPKLGDREKLIELRSKQSRIKTNLESGGGTGGQAATGAYKSMLLKDLDKTNKQIGRLSKKVPKTPQAQALIKAANEVQSRFNKMAEQLKQAEGKEFFEIQRKMRNLANTQERIMNTFRKMKGVGKDI